jgi:hypothetical protein
VIFLFAEGQKLSNGEMVTMDEEDDLEVGAVAISRNIFKNKFSPRQVYRMPEEGWPIFKIRGKLAARPRSMRAEMARREAEATRRVAPDEAA